MYNLVIILASEEGRTELENRITEDLKFICNVLGFHLKISKTKRTRC